MTDNEVYEGLSENYKDHIDAILEVEGMNIEDITDVGAKEITIEGQGFRWFRDEEEAEEVARTYLTDDGYIWKEAVAAGNTIDGLEEWAETLIRSRGWSNIISSYDSLERVAQLKDGTWFPYIRSD